MPVLAAGTMAMMMAMASATPAGAQEAAAADPEHWTDALLHWVTLSIELAGIAVIVVGAVVATATYVKAVFGSADREKSYHGFRASLGRAILLGLEFLVAADIIATVAIEPTLNSVAVLAGIVLIRTFLSFSLEAEIEGRLPWQRKRQTQAASGGVNQA